MKNVLMTTLALIAFKAHAAPAPALMSALQAKTLISDGLMNKLGLGISNGHGPCAVSEGQEFDASTNTLYGVITLAVPNLALQEFRYELNNKPLQIQQFGSRDWQITRTYDLNLEYPQSNLPGGRVTREKTLHVKNNYPGPIFVQISDTLQIFCEIKQK